MVTVVEQMMVDTLHSSIDAKAQACCIRDEAGMATL
ncbi:hypothetical protein CCACVL1_08354 [Corchorus capsularis]|uniref:Uncharacterized protein n=1 Tax=Corchorus capsularis TaxID=210143 RepID=A0A1R3J0X9_COCAP|nr:hypothetical protein CCACVL1_08354 [Corchorus capsularis]